MPVKYDSTKNYTGLIEDNYLYISHMDDELKFWRLPTEPDSIQDSMQSNFKDQSALGRTAPVYTYSNSGPRSVTVDLSFHRDMMDDINMSWSNATLGYGEDYVDNLIKAIQSIALPKYNITSHAIEPPMIALRLSKQLFIKGVVTGSVNVTYSKPILYNGKYAQVKVGFTIYEVDPYDATDIYKNGSLRGVVNTLKTGMNIEEGDK